MISRLAGIPRLSALVVRGCLVGFLTLSSIELRAQQDDPDRPHLKRQTQPIDHDDTPAVLPEATANAVPREIGEGLILPAVGHVWARDKFDGQPQLIQLKYVPTELDRHTASNILKTEMAPFVYKPKHSVEIAGAAAGVRLHDPHVCIYIRGYATVSEDAAVAHATSTQTELTLVKAESKKDRRIISTIAFTQFTESAARRDLAIVVNVEKLANTDWKKITSNEPLPPGEYALTLMPRGQNLLPTIVFDFAIDPQAPANPNAVMPTAATSSESQSPPSK